MLRGKEKLNYCTINMKFLVMLNSEANSIPGLVSHIRPYILFCFHMSALDFSKS